MRGTSGGLRPDPVTEEVRARYTGRVQNLERLAQESWTAGNFAGASAFLHSAATAAEQAANEQNRGWILRAGSDDGLASRASAHGTGRP
jgi:hypothetical protein